MKSSVVVGINVYAMCKTAKEMLSMKNASLVTLFVTFFMLMLGILINLIRLNVADLTEKEKCPACFGISMCREIDNSQISFNFADFYSVFNNLFGIKNVYYGNYINKRVIMKKLARNSELSAFDETICTSTTFTSMIKSCSQGKNVKIDFDALIRFEFNNANITDPNVKIRLCPTVEKINNLLENVKNPNSEGDDYLKYLWTTLKINPEPIVLQILSANDHWPVPKYFGACGRLIIEEFSGQPLSAFTAEPWIRRAKIASSLLDAANKFTFKNPDFAFYLTDISQDNIAVNDKDEAIFIDLENIIIVDKNPSPKVLSKLDAWGEIYFNNIDIGCPNCFVFSASDICQHKISDHNYYAVCQILIEGSGVEAVYSHGFLHNPPKYILEEYPMIKNLLKHCSMPKRPYSRIDSGMKLKKVLDAIVSNVKSHA